MLRIARLTDATSHGIATRLANSLHWKTPFANHVKISKGWGVNLGL